MNPQPSSPRRFALAFLALCVLCPGAIASTQPPVPMPPTPPPSTRVLITQETASAAQSVPQLVALIGTSPEAFHVLLIEAHDLRAKIDKDVARVAAIAAAFVIAKPAGKHEEPGGKSCTVISPADAIKPTPAEVDKVRASLAKHKGAFASLFSRNVSFKPSKGFRDRLEALTMTSPKLRARILALCGKPTESYIKWV